MEKLKSLHVKRLSFNKRSKDYYRKEKSLTSVSDKMSLLPDLREEKDPASLKHKHSILKFRSSITLSDPNLPLKFQELFAKNSAEVLLKHYKCIYVTHSASIIGKMYISSNFLWFVECKIKNLELVIRLKDVQCYTTNESSVNISAYNQTYAFKEFSESGVAFLSNYLRLNNIKNPVVNFGVAPDSLSISTSSSLLSTPSLPPEGSDYVSSVEDGEPSLPTYESQCQKQSSHASQSSHLHLLDYKIPFDDTIAMVSDVAYKASCIPLLILTRMLSFGVCMATCSLQVTTPFGSPPPRSFTKFITYFMLAFLAISLAYIYCHLEHLPLDDPAWSFGSANRNIESGLYCGGEFEKLTSSLHSLSEMLRRLEARLMEDEVLMNLRAVP